LHFLYFVIKSLDSLSNLFFLLIFVEYPERFFEIKDEDIEEYKAKEAAEKAKKSGVSARKANADEDESAAQ
jgi:hypothetical protein